MPCQIIPFAGRRSHSVPSADRVELEVGLQRRTALTHSGPYRLTFTSGRAGSKLVSRVAPWPQTMCRKARRAGFLPAHLRAS